MGSVHLHGARPGNGGGSGQYNIDQPTRREMVQQLAYLQVHYTSSCPYMNPPAMVKVIETRLGVCAVNGHGLRLTEKQYVDMHTLFGFGLQHTVQTGRRVVTWRAKEVQVW